MSKKLTVTVVEKNNAFILVDSEGYTCGIFATQQDADKAIAATTANINRGYIPEWVIRKSLKKNFIPNRKSVRQVSKNKYTTKPSQQVKSST